MTERDQEVATKVGVDQERKRVLGILDRLEDPYYGKFDSPTWAILRQIRKEVVGGDCPDGGTCHHGCVGPCFRVACCGPLTDYGEEWTESDLARDRRLRGESE